MTILSAMQAASQRLMGEKPQVFFGSSNQFEQEIVDLVNEAGKDIAQSHDWQALTKINTYQGDGTSEAFDMPADYSRMLVVTDLLDPASWAWGYHHVKDLNEYLFLKAQNYGPWPGLWIVFGDQIHFAPAPGTEQQAQFPYISRNIARDQMGATKAEFTDDSDEFVLPERLLTLWLIWRWRENKKLDNTGDEENFQKAFSEYASKDAGSTVIRRNYSWVNRYNWVRAWPWELGSNGV